MLKSLLLVALLAVAAYCQEPNPNVECFKCRDRRNHKDMYPHPTDCHKYYQCFYTGDGQAMGIERACASGFFWNDIILQCTPEGSEPCNDRCQDRSITGKKCFASSDNCAAYFVCSGWASYPFCCPKNTAFSEDDCTCHESETCFDECSNAPLHEPTTTEAAEVFDDHCIDPWGNTLRADTNSDFFILVGEEDREHRVRCAVGSKFDLTACTCSQAVELEARSPSRQCTMYFPFDSDEHDHSIHKFRAEMVGTATISSDVSANGEGSLHNQEGGHLELPFKKTTISSGDAALSFCFFFRCENPPCQFASGGLLSTREVGTSSYPTIISVNDDTLRFECALADNGDSFIALNIPLTRGPSSAHSDFYHICLAFNSTNVQVYLNNEMVIDASPEGECHSLPSHCPMTIGTDHEYGDFVGYLDELLECPYKMDATSVDAHFNGRDSLRAAGMIP